MYTLEDIKEEVEKGTSIESLYKKFGGFDIYIPKVMPNYKEKVLLEFNGYNHAVLATKYNVSKNQIYKIIREDKRTKGVC
jgi:Mor family transcriptional regulator